MSLISRAQAVKILLQSIDVIQDKETIQLTNALGRVLAGDIYSGEYSPQTRVSAVDGFALCIEDIKRYRAKLKIQGTIRAGQPISSELRSIKPGYAIQIMTGAVVPQNCSAIVKVEDVDINSDEIFIKTKLRKNENIRAKGEDIKPGELLLKDRSVIDFGALSLLMLTGNDPVNVYKQPRIAVVATGDELIDFRQVPEYYQKREVNSWIVAILLGRANKNVKRYSVVRDDYKTTVQRFAGMLEENDILVVSGGISKGKYDFVREAAEELGFRFVFHGVKQKPGKPFAFALKQSASGKKYFFGLPGNPVATISTTLLTLIPVLKYMETGVYREPPTFEAEVVNDFVKDDLRLEFARAVYNQKNNRVRILKNQSSGVISSFTRGNAYAILPANRRVIKKGTRIKVMPFDYL